jgi:hypothetical protein
MKKRGKQGKKLRKKYNAADPALDTCYNCFKKGVKQFLVRNHSFLSYEYILK